MKFQHVVTRVSIWATTYLFAYWSDKCTQPAQDTMIWDSELTSWHSCRNYGASCSHFQQWQIWWAVKITSLSLIPL